MVFFHPGDLDAWGWFIVALWVVVFVVAVAAIAGVITYLVLFIREKMKAGRPETRNKADH